MVVDIFLTNYEGKLVDIRVDTNMKLIVGDKISISSTDYVVSEVEEKNLYDYALVIRFYRLALAPGTGYLN